MNIAMRDLKLDELVVVYPGLRCQELAEGVRLLPLSEIAAI